MSGYGFASTVDVTDALNLAEQKKLAQQVTWKRLLYAEDSPQSEVSYTGFFLAEQGRDHI